MFESWNFTKPPEVKLFADFWNVSKARRFKPTAYVPNSDIIERYRYKDKLYIVIIMELNKG